MEQHKGVFKRIEYNTGQKVGECIYLREADPVRWKGSNIRYAFFICPECGNEYKSRISDVKNGKSTTCCKGFRGIENHGFSSHSLYAVYNGILRRCYCATEPAYKDYGARGVIVCAEWRNDKISFFKWAIENGWQNGLQIDKDIIPKKLGVPALLYSPETCCFVTPRINSRNRRNNNLLTYKGETMCIAEWADKLSINKQTISSRIRYGMTMDKVLSTKKHPNHPINKSY